LEVTLDLALVYYELGEYKVPLSIESLFSSMTVLVRDMRNYKKDEVLLNFSKIKLVLLDRNLFTFDEATFDKQWKQCNADERRSIAHGRGSKQIHEYDKKH